MTIETVLSAKSLWFMDMRGLNPRGRNLYPLIGPLLKQWYGFTEPTEFDENKGIQYRGGEFSPSGQNTDITGIAVTLYSNGLVAETCTTTADTDLWLGSALEHLAKERIIVYRPEMVKRKQYATELVVRPRQPLKPLETFSALYRLLVELIYPQYADNVHFETAGFVFDVDHTFPHRQVSFTFQRRAGVAWEENLYYSHGPFSNEQHQLVLDKLEKALLGG